MRYIIVMLLSATLLAAINPVWAGVNVAESNDQGIVLELSCPQLQFEKILTKGMDYYRVSAAGCPSLTDPGRPALPVIGAMIMVPPNTIPEIISIEAAAAVNYKKIPAPAPEILVDKETVPDPAYYRGGQAYPANQVTLSRPVRAGLKKMAFISFSPVRFYPAGNNLSYVKSVKVRIRFRPSSLGDQPVAAGKAGQPLSDIGNIAAKSAINQTQALGWASRPAASKSTSSTIWPDTLPYKIVIETEGIYKIGYYDLLQAGLNPGWFDPRSYKLFNQGREIPVYFKGQADGVFDQDDYFEFYGQRLKGDSSYYHPYSRDNVYWLGLGGSSFGSRMIEEDGSPVSQGYVLPGSYRYKIHLEKDSLFCRLSSIYSDQTDRWFWRRIDERDSMVLSFSLPGLDSGATDSVYLSVSLHGYTALDLPTNDHWAIISLNGNSLDNYVKWDGQAPYTFIAKLDPDSLNAGSNRLVLKHGPPDTIDSYFLNWMEVDYSRNYTAAGGALTFKTPSPGLDGLLRYEIDGFENQSIDLYKLGVSKITGAKVERNPDGVTYRMTFEDQTSSQTSYYAVQNDDQHKLKPKAIVANHVPAQSLTDPSQAAQYLIITTEEFSSTAEKLAAFRGTQFKGSKVVLASDIYDAFNYGIPQDRPIKEFLRQAFLTWQIPPAYVLLLGGGSWDPRNLSGHVSSDKIPVHLTRTADYGPTADDNYYADILDDDQYSQLPDIILGRIPVYNANDCQVWEAKRLSYEQQPMLDQWQRDFLIIAGRNNAGENFNGESDILAATLDPRYTISKVYHSATATTQDLLDQFHEGSVLAGFYGHGSGQVWSHDSFFRIDEVARLNNWGRWPLVGAFTCYSGAFDIPDTISISQALLLKTYSGAIGVYASSGPSWGILMEQVFFEAVNERELTKFGDIMVSSKFDLAAKNSLFSGQAGEMIASYNLLGDPGMRLAVPNRDIVMTLSPASLLPGDSIMVMIQGGFKAGSITLLSLCDSTGKTSANYSIFSDSAGKVETRVQVPASMIPGKALMKAYVRDADSSWITYEEIGVNRPVFYGTTASPSRPVNLVDSVEIVSGAASLWGVDSVWCEWNTSASRSDTGLLHRTAMDSLVPGYYRTRDKIINAGPSDTVLNYRICLSGPGIGKEVSGFNHHHLLSRADLSPRNKISGTENVYLGGKRRLTLSADIFNYGEIRADSTPVYFYRYNGGFPVTDSAGMVVDSIMPGESVTPSVPWPLSAEEDRVNVIIDPNFSQWPPDQDTSNNHLLSGERVIPPDGRVYTQLGLLGSGDTVVLYKYPIRYYLPDSSLSDSAVAVAGFETITQTSALNPARQPGLKLIGDINLDAYFVVLTDSSRALLNNKKLWLSMNWPQLSTVSDLSLVNLYRFNYRQGIWQKVPGGADSSRAWGTCDSMGLFIPMIGTDTTAPLITASLDKQATGWGTEIRVSRPQYSVLIEDQNGINLDSVWVKKDGVLVPRNEYNLPAQPQDHTSIPLAYAPYLTDGLHSLEFGACDNLGNSSSVTVQSVVKVGFGLDALACYPTPVDGNYATFYFFVGDQAKNYELKIYTVAGRLIKTFKGGSASGVKTMRWDVDDDSGQKVANGVYFYTLEVWSESGERQKKTEKLAVLR